jgi:hypothetical protein
VVVDIHRPLTIATSLAEAFLPIGTNTNTHLLPVDKDTTTTGDLLLLCAMAGGAAPITAKEEEFLPVGGNATEAIRTA